MNEPEIPPEVARRLAEFRAAAKSGTLQLDIKSGRIVGFSLTESARIESSRQEHR
jgi:hypothetical protein